MKTNNKSIYSLTLAAGESFFDNKHEQKFFFNSLIHSKKIFFRDFNIKYNYFLISNKHVYKEKKFENLIYSPSLKKHGSFGSLIYFLSNLKKLPDTLLVNYLDKEISISDFESLLNNNSDKNLILSSKISSKNNTENFYFDNNTYEFDGFLILRRDELEIIKDLDKKYYNNNLTYLFNSGIIKQNKFKVINSKLPVNEIRREVDIAKSFLGSKSKSLSNVSVLKSAQIPPFFTVNRNNTDDLENKIRNFKKNVIIRSDSSEEDSFSTSNAGAFLSIGPIPKNNLKEIKQGINKVFKSYDDKSASGKVIVQEYVDNMAFSGVITTRLLQNSAPYNLISISRNERSDVVTSGNSNNLINIYIHKNVDKLNKNLKKYQKILNLINELKELISYELLDIEFAVDKKDKLHLLQVRPLIISNDKNYDKKYLINNIRKFQQYQNIEKNIYGEKTIFSNMSDWNPVEMLGESPNHLAISLYKTFITNSAWHIQRREFGYRGECQQQLMKNFENKCYIDIRASLNSFLTKSLSKQECKNIVEFQISQLESNPELHDKIEFFIAETSYSKGIENNINKKYKNVISSDAIVKWVEDLKIIEKRYKKILTTNSIKIEKYFNSLDENHDYLNKIDAQNIVKNMSVPFAHHARLGFVYISQLNQFVQKEVISNDDKQLLLNSLNTISNMFSQDLHLVKNKKLSRKKFISKYGHIRPSNYDINSENLKTKGPDFLNNLMDNLVVSDEVEIDLTEFTKKIDKYFQYEKIKTEASEWINMFRASVSSRENSKFMYSKAIDIILNQLNDSKFSKELDIKNLDFEKYIQKNEFVTIEHNSLIELPDVITNSEDFLYFESLNSKPNYIGKNITKGELIEISQDSIKSIADKIVILPNADPGWDWVFNLNIKGLITKYGGPNSHMAIRAAEKNITSIFGVGEMLYQQIKESNTIEINPLGKSFYLNI